MELRGSGTFTPLTCNNANGETDARSPSSEELPVFSKRHPAVVSTTRNAFVLEKGGEIG
jgi:hypothetical protein